MKLALSKTQRKNLREDGWTRRDIDDLDARLDEGGDDRDRGGDRDDDRRSRRKSNGNGDAGRVSVFEGAAAERVLAKLGLDNDEDDEDDDDDDDDDRKSRSRSRSRSRDRDDDKGGRRTRYFDR